MGNLLRSAFTLLLSGFSFFVSAQEYIPEFSGYIQNEHWVQYVSPVRDSLGNIILAGTFENQLTIGNQRLEALGKRDLFISSINRKGIGQWVQTMHGPGYPNVVGIWLDNNQQFSLLGVFNDSLINPNFKCVLPGRNHLFFAQFDRTGKFLQSGILLPGFRGKIMYFAIDSSGNFIFTGTFKRKFNLNNRAFHSNGKEDIFLVKVNSAGRVQNMVTFGGPGADKPSGITGNGDHFLLYGNFEKNMKVGDSTLISAGSTDAFIVRFDSSLTFKEAFSLGGTQKDDIRTVQVDEGGNLYASGTFKNRLPLGSNDLNSNGLSDIYVVKLDTLFHPVYCRSWGGPSNDWPVSFIKDINNRYYLSGSFKKVIRLGEDTLKTEDRFSDAFLLMMNDSGVVSWSKQFSGRSEENALFLLKYDPDRLWFAASFFQEIVSGKERIATNSFPGLYWTLFLDPCSLIHFSLPSDRYLCRGDSNIIDAGPGYASYFWNDGLSHNQSLTVVDTGWYFVQVTDQFGCIASDSIRVSVDSIGIKYQVRNEVIPDGYNGRIEVEIVGGYAPYQFSWTSGETTNILEDLTAGDYTVTVTDSLSCELSTHIRVESTVTSGILDIFNFPNPVDDLTRVIYSLPEDTWLEIALYDLEGRKIYTLYNGTNTKGKYGFDWAGGKLNNGIYYLRISTSEGTVSKKMIIDHN